MDLQIEEEKPIIIENCVYSKPYISPQNEYEEFMNLYFKYQMITSPKNTLFINPSFTKKKWIEEGS